MSQEKSSNTLIVLLVVGGVLGSLGLCCFTGIGLVVYRAQRAEDEAMHAFEEEMARQRAEDRARERRYFEDQRPRDVAVGADAPLSQTGIAGFRVPTAPPPSNHASRQITARVTTVTGSTPVRVGDVCEFPVEYRERRSGGYWCRVEVRCGGQRLYGGGTVGFVPCVLYDSPLGVAGLDGETTMTDTDGAFAIDTRDSLFMVRDDATGAQGEFYLEARIESVR